MADPAELPVHKVWSWGNDREAATWRTALSDDDSGYVELQSGLFRNQETYAILEPQETVHFSEYWLPVRDLGGITRANVDAVLHMDRIAATRVALALDVTRDLPGARLIVRQQARTLLDRTASLSPREVWRATLDEGVVTDAPVTFELSDGHGTPVLTHTENSFDSTPAAQQRLGSTSNARSRSAPMSADDVVEDGLVDELEGRRLAAMSVYRAGLERYPHSLALLKQPAGSPWHSHGPTPARTRLRRRSTGCKKPPPATRPISRRATTWGWRSSEPIGRVTRVSTWRRRSGFERHGPPPTLQLARLFAREGHVDAALQQVQALDQESARATLTGALEIALLRRQGRKPEARERAGRRQAIDPADSLLRYERTLLGDTDPDLWSHLGADANRVLDLSDQYLAIGDYAAALGLLDRTYPVVASPEREAGAVTPQESPLIAYYRGFARAHVGGSTSADYALAATLPVTYAFPNRRSSFAVLKAAIERNPNDATARFLLGSLFLANGLLEPAIAEWQRVRQVRPSIPTLHRNLGLALLHAGMHDREARAVLEEGLVADSTNVDVYLTLDGVLSAANASPRDRAAALRRFPAPERMPASMVFKLALALGEAGDARAAEALFHHRFFPQEEGGTSVRTVYAQVRLTSSRTAAAAGDCVTARDILDSFTREQQDLAFTAGGLADTLQPPGMARQAAAVEWACARRDAAQSRWQRLANGLNGDGGPLAVAIADEARGRLGLSRTPENRRRLEEALETTTRTLESGGTSNPGSLEYARALVLAALGRADESRQSLRRVFLYPDRNLSHALARTAMNDASADRGDKK